MTDHKYPNEVSSCHSMLKKRDGIIEQLTAEHQPSESILELKEEISRLEKEMFDQVTETVSDINKLQIERDALTETVKNLQKQLDQECDSNAALEDDIDMQNKALKTNTVYTVYTDKIKVLEEKLSLCDKYYKEQQDKVHKVGRHVQELVILLDID